MTFYWFTQCSCSLLCMSAKTSGTFADQLVTGHEKGRQKTNDGGHADESSTAHEVAHSADNPDFGIDSHGQGCREKAQGADDNGGDRGGRGFDDGGTFFLSGHPF